MAFRIPKIFSAVILVASGVALLGVDASSARGGDGFYRERVKFQQPQEVFYNHYVGPGPSGVPAQMYLSPGPVPANVGHTYNTYPPFYPSEYMHRHDHAWYTYHPGAGWTRTHAYYSAHPVLDLLGHMRRF